MRDLEFLTGHVTFKLPYNQIYQMKNPKIDAKLSAIVAYYTFYPRFPGIDAFIFLPCMISLQ